MTTIYSAKRIATSVVPLISGGSITTKVLQCASISFSNSQIFTSRFQIGSFRTCISDLKNIAGTTSEDDGAFYYQNKVINHEENSTLEIPTVIEGTLNIEFSTRYGNILMQFDKFNFIATDQQGRRQWNLSNHVNTILRANFNGHFSQNDEYNFYYDCNNWTWTKIIGYARVIR